MVTNKQAQEMAEPYRMGWLQGWIAGRLCVAQSTVEYHLRQQRVKRRRCRGNGRLRSVANAVTRREAAGE